MTTRCASARICTAFPEIGFQLRDTQAYVLRELPAVQS